MSSWRDTQTGAEQIRREKRWQPVRVAGVDGTWLNGQCVMVAVDRGNGEPLAIGVIDEKDMKAVTRWLKRLKQQHDIGAIVTDDLRMYRGITEQLELGHQVCQFHVRRWVGMACWDLGQRLPEEWLWMIDQIKMIMEDLPPDGSKPNHCRNCKIQACATERGLALCVDCEDFPCVLIKRMDKSYRQRYHFSLVENAQRFQFVGGEQFMREEVEKWTCAAGGGAVSQHDRACTECGKEIEPKDE